ncbi:MAG TPA: rhomboid family intramembrane serine protease [Terriglobales bacterium]|jgi:membrane associated rhomboid family serine protease|nr:rhomboid family intramembrane serine protease [Terriglobales bacterium]
MFPLRDDQPVFSTPFVTYFLIAINLLIYFFEWQIGLQSRGQLNGLLTQFGVVPRLEIGLLTGTPVFSPAAALLPIFTSMFLHGSLLHVLGNMWMLWIFGDNIEDYLGHFAYLVFYLLSGVAASLTHIMFNASSRMPSIGASGAIAGVMGAYFILYPKARVLIWFPPIFIFPVPAWLMLGYWGVSQFLSGAATAIAETSQTTGGIAFWAHVGGFVVGILLIKLFPQRRGRYRYGTW